jgi:predicted DNA-binding ribbon-helix-helix protein
VSNGHWVWEGARGRVEVRQLGPRFVSVDLVGRVEDEAATMIEAVLEQVAPIPGVAMYWDASRLDSFTSSFRSACTDHLLANRKTIGELATLSQSALIAMAISATNLALGGLVNSYRDRDKFFAAQRATAEKQGLSVDKLAG